MQLTHYSNKFHEKTFPIVLVCDNVTNAPNIGSLFRTADTFGVDRLILCGKDLTIGRKVTRTSRSTEKYVNYEIQPSIEAVVKSLIEKGYHIISLEITENSTPIESMDFTKHSPLALVIGDENFGVSDAILEQSNVIIHIEMFGKNSSMNVVQATNIALFEITKQLKSTY